MRSLSVRLCTPSPNFFRLMILHCCVSHLIVARQWVISVSVCPCSIKEKQAITSSQNFLSFLYCVFFAQRASREPNL
jgi:hypothetical protein